MATRQEIEDNMTALSNQRAAIQNQIDDLNAQHQAKQSRMALLGPDFRHIDLANFQSTIRPLVAKQKLLHQQEQQLSQDRTKVIQAQKVAEQAPIIAAKQAAAAKKAASDNLEDASARAFGLGKGKGIDYLTKRKEDLFYDPKMGKIGVPPEKPAKEAADKTNKKDPEALKEVQDRLNKFTKEAGVQGSLSPASFFGGNGFTSEVQTDKDGKETRVYDADGTPISIPESIVPQLQERYNDHFATPADKTPSQTGVKYIPVNTFQQANQALNQLTGESNESPVDRFLASRSANRQAGGTNGPGDVRPFPSAISQAVPEWGAADSTPVRSSVPSVDQSTQFDANGNRVGPTDLTRIQPATYKVPDTFAPTTQFGQVPAVATTKVIPRPITSTDLPTGVIYLNQADYNNSGVNPIFAQIAANNKENALNRGQQALQSGGASGAPREFIPDLLEAQKAGLPPSQGLEFARKRATARQINEATLPYGQNVPLLERAENIIGNDANALYDVGANALSQGAGMVGTVGANILNKAKDLYPVQTAMRGIDALYNPQPDIYQMYLDAKLKREIAPDVTPQQYADTIATQTAAANASQPEPELSVPTP